MILGTTATSIASHKGGVNMLVSLQTQFFCQIRGGTPGDVFLQSVMLESMILEMKNVLEEPNLNSAMGAS